MSRDFIRNAACCLFGLATCLQAQEVSPPGPRSGSEILWSLQKLDTLGRALFVAAHPDDENTNLISYLSLGRKYDTAYLSLTRGDGGQNLIGSELRDELGVIRTQELLEARRIDGGRQFFTRAKDFGFSKNPEETLEIWDRDAVLADTVWVIRSFQPDVIVTRFSPEPSSTHGHHTASAILALEAFEAAADASRFPEQLEYVKPWQAKRVVWNTSSWFFQNGGRDFDESQYVKLEVGGYEPLLGKSFNEIASASRSMHLSQGFGTRIDRGSRVEYFKHLAGAGLGGDLFDQVDTSWNRVEGAEGIQNQLTKIIESFDVSRPELAVPALIALRENIDQLDQTSWSLRKGPEVDEIILACMGLDIRLVAGAPYVRDGESLKLNLEVINRSNVEASLTGIALPFAELEETRSVDLVYNERIDFPVSAKVLESIPLPQPYWLAKEGTLGMFDVDNQMLIGLAENQEAFTALAAIAVMGRSILVELPLMFREVDPAKGESIRPVIKLPEASVAFANPVSLFPNFVSRTVEVKVSAILTDVAGRLQIQLPSGWTSEPKFYDVETIREGGERNYGFTVTPRTVSENATISATFSTDLGVFDKAVTRINFEHLRELTVFSPASTRAVTLEVARAGGRVGYLPGAGDTVPDSIREIGYEVVILSAVGFKPEDLSGLDTVVVGIRALNTVDGIDAIMDDLFAFTKAGGTVIVQYNTSNRLKTDKLAPYPLSLSRDRVTDENAEVRWLAPGHPAMTKPNKITPLDFYGWTQERGLYFPNSWSDQFVPLLALNDAGEPSREGSLLVARYGEGYFVYTGISWFRQLPAGVPGAYRLFANLLSLGHTEKDL